MPQREKDVKSPRDRGLVSSLDRLDHRLGLDKRSWEGRPWKHLALAIGLLTLATFLTALAIGFSEPFYVILASGLPLLAGLQVIQYEELTPRTRVVIALLAGVVWGFMAGFMVARAVM